ncbi:hypothetical protein WICMUC_001958 [Wickerhamomyces mucosus]|uniref:non-specific serine/threonine protein kinase n=1 Tax=Wickerhamomyces mucosus TaxID=1378264 RepID=A0A9P8PSZ5_9ASCO|nr:hypothetical protein WICMUC_001958 [Wickerhamomyces mucosus]
MLRERRNGLIFQQTKSQSPRSSYGKLNTKAKAKYNLSDLVLDINNGSNGNDFDISNGSFKLGNNDVYDSKQLSDSDDDEPYRGAQIINISISDNENDTNMDDSDLFNSIEKENLNIQKSISTKSGALQENTSITNIITSNSISDKRIPLNNSTNINSVSRNSSSLSQLRANTRTSINSNSSKRWSILSFNNSSTNEERENSSNSSKRFSINSTSSSKKRFSIVSNQSTISTSSQNQSNNNIAKAINRMSGVFSSSSVSEDIKPLNQKSSIANLSIHDPLEPVLNSDQISVSSVTPSLRASKSRFRLSTLFNRKEGTGDNESIRSLRGKNSLNDLRKSMLSFSPSATNLLRSLNRKDSIDRSMISLPRVSNKETKENLKNRLKTSSSIISINSIVSATSPSNVSPAINFQEHTLNMLTSLLQLTTFGTVLKFEDIYNEQKYSEMIKISEASFSEIYKSNNSISKIIPFDNDLTSDNANIEDIIQELKINLILKDTPGFIKLNKTMVVKGVYPSRLLKLWDNYDGSNASNNKRPDRYTNDQLYLIMELEFGGLDLEKFLIHSWQDASKIFWSLVQILNNAEMEFKFEHRDLHWGNIVVDEELNVRLIDYTLSRLEKNDQIIFTRLDSQEFFKGKGDYQFDIYRIMRNEFYSKINGDSSIDWSKSNFKTNIFWLHYILDKLINFKKIKSKDTKFRTQLIKLSKLINPTQLQINHIQSCGDLLKYNKA